MAMVGVEEMPASRGRGRVSSTPAGSIPTSIKRASLMAYGSKRGWGTLYNGDVSSISISINISSGSGGPLPPVQAKMLSPSTVA